MLRNKHDNNVEAREGVKAVELKNSPQVRGIMNGPQKLLTPTPSPRKIPANPHTAQAASPAAAAAHASLPQCTLISPEKQLGSTPSPLSAAEAGAPCSDRLPDISAPLAQAAGAGSQTEINTMQHVNLAAPDRHGHEAEACGQAPGRTDVLSQPNTLLPPVVVRPEGGDIALCW